MAPEAIGQRASEFRIIEDADICVLGGSCTSAFAAVRAIGEAVTT